MILSEIGCYLQAANLGTRNISADTPGDIFEGGGPNMPDEAIFIFSSPGRGFDLVHTNPLPNTEMPRIQIRVRSAAYKTGEIRINRIMSLLTFHNKILTDEDGNQVFYLSCTPVSSWTHLDRDPQQRHIFAINFEIEKRLSL